MWCHSARKRGVFHLFPSNSILSQQHSLVSWPRWNEEIAEICHFDGPRVWYSVFMFVTTCIITSIPCHLLNTITTVQASSYVLSVLVPVRNHLSLFPQNSHQLECLCPLSPLLWPLCSLQSTFGILFCAWGNVICFVGFLISIHRCM